MKKLVSFFIILSLSSCSFWTPQRTPSSVQNESDLFILLDTLSQKISSDVESSKYCHEELEKYYQIFLSLEAKDIGMEKLDKDEISTLVEKSFETRIELKNKLVLLNDPSDDGRKCLAKVRSVVRALRYMEDYFIELYMTQNGEKLDAEKFVTLEGEFPFHLVNPKFKHLFKSHKDLSSGDVILSRGNAYSSAAIARIGEDDAQFSHLSFVFKDGDGKLHTSEAHIEVGNVVAPIKKHIDQKNARTVVFRYKDVPVAHKASKCIYEKIDYHQNEKEKNIKYDFSMDYKDDSQLFCSEVVYAGFQCVSKDIDVPRYKTKFSKGQIPFLNSLGIKIDKDNIDEFDTFGPGDIEFDSDFEIVAEWRNPAKIRDSRVKDAILTKIFEWMELDGHYFKPPFKIRAKSDFAWISRRFTWLPFLRGLKEKFPKNMSSDQLELFIVLDLVGEKLQERINEKQKASPLPLSMKQMFMILDEYRVEDRARYDKRKRKSHWMKYFRPPKKKVDHHKHRRHRKGAHFRNFHGRR